VAASRNRQREAREARDRLRRYEAGQAVHSHRVRRRLIDNIAGIAGGVVVITLAAITQVVYFTAGPGAPEPLPSISPSPSASVVAGQNTGDVPPKSIAEDRDWTGTLKLNDVTLGIELDGKAAPQATAVFVDLVRSSFYQGKTCHRLVDSGAYLIQCGSVNGDGTGDVGFSYGPIENAPADGIYRAGTIAMARQADPYSQGSQFFITYEDSPLDASTGGYTVFGHVTSGLDDLIEQIADHGVAGDSPDPDDGPPAVATTITGVSVE